MEPFALFPVLNVSVLFVLPVQLLAPEVHVRVEDLPLNILSGVALNVIFNTPSPPFPSPFPPPIQAGPEEHPCVKFPGRLPLPGQSSPPFIGGTHVLVHCCVQEDWSHEPQVSFQ